MHSELHSEVWLYRTVAFTREYFDMVAKAYWKQWRKTAEKNPEHFAHWMDEVRRQISIETKELWVPQPEAFRPSWFPTVPLEPVPIPDNYDREFLTDWYTRKVEPVVQQVLDSRVKQWKQKAEESL